MSPEICPLGPAEELIDAESFHFLYTELLAPKPGRRPAPHSERSALPSASRAPRPRADRIRRRPRRSWSSCTASPARTSSAPWSGEPAAHADAVAFFVARGGRIQATCCDPDPPRRPGPLYCAELKFPLASVLEQQRVYHGAPGRDPLTSRILRSLGREGVREIVLVPICVYGRTVAFLYADAGWKPFAAASVAEFSSIGSGIARIFERLLLERKRDEAGRTARPRR